MARKQNPEEYMEQYIGHLGGEQDETTVPQQQAASLGTLRHVPGEREQELREDMEEITQRKGLTRIGENIRVSTEIRDGWMAVDRSLLGERSMFYPQDWTFKIRPATVEAIRNWSTIDDENWSSIDDVFNEVLSSCLAIRTNDGPRPWNSINSWDRFFFLLLIREYTFTKGEKEIKFNSACSNCDVDVEFKLTATSLGYDMPDPEVMQYYDSENRTWNIDPAEFDVETPIERITLYCPTLEKDANYKAYLTARLQENRNTKLDTVFMRFVTWLCPKISKDPQIAKQQIRQAELMFKSWDTEMFSFMDDVLKNIMVTPGTHLTTRCPSCGEEVTARIEFQNGIRNLFAVSSRHKKFGKK